MSVQLIITWALKATEVIEAKNARDARALLVAAARAAKADREGNGSAGKLVAGRGSKKRTLALYEIVAKSVVALMVLGMAALAIPTKAQADPTYCSFEYPYTIGYNQVCTGVGTSCYYGGASNCSPVPNVQGTWNPRGYTPCTSWSCDIANPNR